jgi:regulatory protein
MKITKMLRRRGHIYEVRFDDGTYINLDIAYANGKGISEGMEIDDETSIKMEDESDSIRCTSRALYYLSQSDKSVKKLKEKLIRAGFEERFVNSSIERLKELGYVNDDEYALKMARKCYEEALSYRMSIDKLVGSGISRDKAKEVCVFSHEEEQEKIKRLLNSKYSLKMGTAEDIQKTAAALGRRGFGFSDIREVLKEFDMRLKDGEYYNE